MDIKSNKTHYRKPRILVKKIKLNLFYRNVTDFEFPDLMYLARRCSTGYGADCCVSACNSCSIGGELCPPL